MKKKLTPREEKFAAHFALNGDKTAAYRKFYSTANMKEATINNNAYMVANRSEVKARIEQLQNKAAEKNEFHIGNVISQWIEIATADPNEIIQHRRVCCRHCHGIDHQYQWIEIEYLEAVQAHLDHPKKNTNAPEAKGGYGFNGTLAPVKSCPMCFGEGVESVHVADTRFLKGAAKRLYGGLKKKNGSLEIIWRNQDEALANLAKFLGMFKNKGDATDKPGEDDILPPLSSDPREAARQYQTFMMGVKAT